MFDIHCPLCNKRYLMSESSIQHMTNTKDGPVAHLTCYHGHRLVRYFRADVSRTELEPVHAHNTSTTRAEAVLAGSRSYAPT